MRLEIDHGIILLYADNNQTRLVIYPRRSASVGHTAARLETPQLSPLDVLIEDSADPSQARPWVWLGHPKAALALADRVLHHLRQRPPSDPWAGHFAAHFPARA